MNLILKLLVERHFNFYYKKNKLKNLVMHFLYFDDLNKEYLMNLDFEQFDLNYLV